MTAPAQSGPPTGQNGAPQQLPPHVAHSASQASAPAHAPQPVATPQQTPQPQPPAAANPAAPVQANAQAGPAGQPQYRPLNVRDALSYLDEVKAVFHSEPEVYNRFLDIMKEFKTQNIDTPGVIDRVSALFRGNPALIQGFNTFLPPGYHIDFYPSSSDQNGYIYVTTPSGTTRSQANYGTNLTGLNGPQSGTEAVPGVGRAPTAPSAPIVADYPRAIAFLDRLKERLAGSPDVFTVTLEVFRYYERDNRSMQTITDILGNLLRPAGAGDLLEDFRLFTADAPPGGLPAHKTPGYALLGSAATSYNPGPSQPPPQQRGRNSIYAPETSRRFQQGPQPLQPMQPPPVQAAAPAPAKKRRVASNAGQPAPTAAAMPGATTARFLNQSAQPYGAPQPAMHEPAPPKPKRAKVTAAPQQPQPEAHGPPMPVFPPPASRTMITADEKAFFERLAGWMDDKSAHHEFLKTLNLYTHDVIELPELIERAHLFIHSSPELWKAFTEILGWREGMHDGGKLRVEANGEVTIENVPIVAEESSVREEGSYGPSYHKLPASAPPACSGRDPLCWDVLNDEWVSKASPAQRRKLRMTRPTKNAFEVALNQSEEARYEHDFWIEANLRTIALLEPIASRIMSMSEEERASFRLKSGLGGSKAVYQGVIKAVYGNAAGAEVLNHLHDHPVSAVPIVLNRLRAKDEEWKKSLRDWNRVWREADALNHPRALNHQAVLAASADRRLLAAKPLVAEIEALRIAQLMMSTPKPQLELAFPRDESIALDALKLVLSFLDRSKTYSDATKDRIEASLRAFVSSYFGIAPESIEESLTAAHADSTDLDDSDSSTIPLSINGNGTLPRKRPGDLRKKAIRNSLLVDAPERPVPATAAGLEGMEGVETVVAGAEAIVRHPDGMDVEMEEVRPVTAEPDSVEETTKPNEPVAPMPQDQDIFCHSHHYVLLRLLHTLQTRLATIKSLESSYQRFLELAEQLFSEQISLKAYHEAISKLLGKSAAPVYTISKLVNAITRATLTCVEATSFGRNQRILQLLEEAKALDGPLSAANRQAYRKAVEASLAPDENVYHLIWSPITRSMSVQLLLRVDQTPRTAIERDERWLSYIAAFSSDQPVIPIHKSPFLRRSVQDETPSVSRRDGLRMRIDSETFKLGYIARTEDALVRNDAVQPSGSGSETRSKRFHQWLEKTMEQARIRDKTPTPPPPPAAATEDEPAPIEPNGDAQPTATAAAAAVEEAEVKEPTNEVVEMATDVPVAMTETDEAKVEASDAVAPAVP